VIVWKTLAYLTLFMRHLTTGPLPYAVRNLQLLKNFLHDHQDDFRKIRRWKIWAASSQWPVVKCPMETRNTRYFPIAAKRSVTWPLQTLIEKCHVRWPVAVYKQLLKRYRSDLKGQTSSSTDREANSI